MRFLSLIVFVLASLGALHATDVIVHEEKQDNLKSKDEGRSATLKGTDVLSIRDGRFHHDGKPSAEIRFNKIDLLGQLYDQRLAGKTLDDANPMVQVQDKALRELHEMGFRTIRFFGLPWGPSGVESNADPKKRKLLYESLDKALSLCDKHIRTPHVDQLALDGVRFQRGYVTAPHCKPSRAGLINGRYQNKFGVDQDFDPMRSEVVTLPERLKTSGYVTGISGKLHVVGGVDKLGFTALKAGSADEGTAAACAAFLKQPRDKPFLHVASFVNPHDICYFWKENAFFRRET